MERHDYELKQREDQMIHVTNESSLVKSFELEMHFDYKGKNYGAYCTYEIEGRGICDIGVYELDSRNVIDPPLFDALYEIVRQYFKEEFHIDDPKYNGNTKTK
jgi:hypothetical protein